MLIFISTFCDGFAVLVESNTTTSSCNGGLGECLIEDDLEFLVNPYGVSRMLIQYSGGTGNKEKAIPCGTERRVHIDNSTLQSRTFLLKKTTFTSPASFM
ncbi:receptor-like protein kinase feronia [Fagus crenata]